MPACLHCGNRISERSVYAHCMRCGTPLGGTEPVAAPARPQGPGCLERILMVFALGVACVFVAALGLGTAFTVGMKWCSSDCDTRTLASVVLIYGSVGGFVIGTLVILFRR